MTSSRALAGVAVLSFVLAAVACSDDDSAGTTTTATSVATTTTTTTTPPTTSSSTTTSTSTSTTSTTTTTTIPVVRGLTLSAQGLGPAGFGVDAEAAIEYVRSILGAPTADTGYVDPASTGAVCPGTEVRFVTWDDLTLLFGDDSTVASGRRHFISYTYGPPFAATAKPYGLATVTGIGIGSTLGELQSSYPAVLVNPSGVFGGLSFQIVEGLSGFLTGIDINDTITTFVGGFGCGE